MMTEPEKNQENDKPSRRKKKATPEEQLLADAFKDCLEDFKDRKRISQDNVDVISSIVEEYLQNFLIIGYNYDGEMLAYTSAKTQLQVDALNTGLSKYIMQNMQRGHQPPNGGFPSIM